MHPESVAGLFTLLVFKFKNNSEKRKLRQQHKHDCLQSSIILNVKNNL